MRRAASLDTGKQEIQMDIHQLKDKKIDCHTHIVSRRIRDEYFDRTSGYALVM